MCNVNSLFGQTNDNWSMGNSFNLLMDNRVHERYVYYELNSPTHFEAIKFQLTIFFFEWLLLIENNFKLNRLVEIDEIDIVLLKNLANVSHADYDVLLKRKSKFFASLFFTEIEMKNNTRFVARELRNFLIWRYRLISLRIIYLRVWARRL